MTPAIEHRQTEEVRLDGRTLRGVVMTYNQRAHDRAEMFEPGAFGPVSTIPLDLQHDAATIIAKDAGPDRYALHLDG